MTLQLRYIAAFIKKASDKSAEISSETTGSEKIALF